MNIGQAAKASGVSAKMLRYYESIDLIPRALRTNAGYRIYAERDIETLRFIKRARDLGVPMERVKLLVGLWQDKNRQSRDVKEIALQQVAELEAKITELTAMKDALTDLARACRGDHRPDCPILKDLEGAAVASRQKPSARSGKSAFAGQNLVGKAITPRRAARAR